MVFELTDALMDSIIKSLENQDKSFLVDAKNGTLIEKTDSIEADEDLYYSIPGWNSADGFALMEAFVNSLHSPMAYNDLQTVLHSGKGVFRGFKNVLKDYPEVLRRWHYFKNKQFQIYVSQWYNSLREIWGLEKLDYETEDVEDLVRDDFEFFEYDSSRDRESVSGYLASIADTECSEWTPEIKGAVTEVLLNQFNYGTSQSESGFICRTVSDEFAGCVVCAKCPSCSEKTVLITGFFVLEQYRGLGIGKELLLLALSKLKEHGMHWVIIANTFIPESMAHLLDRAGFEKLGSGFVANLFAEN